MKIDLSPEVMKTLPEPDHNGLVRVVVSLQVGDDGSADISEINDVPVSGGGDEEEGDAEQSPSAPEADAQDDMPSADQIDQSLYAPPQQ